MKHLISAVAIGLLVVTPCAVAAPARFHVVGVSITDLGTLGGTEAAAWDINYRGNIVGWAKTSLGDSHAFLYRAGVMYDISPTGSKTSFAAAINGRDEVAGNFSPDLSTRHTYRWVAGVSYPLNDNDPSGGPGNSYAWGISDTGLIAGERWSLIDYRHSATAWTSDAVYRTLSLPTPLAGSSAKDVNAGAVVVGYQRFDSSARRWQLLPSGGHTTDSGPLPDLPATTIYGSRSIEGVNAAGSVVGHIQCCTGLAIIRRHAWYWDGTSAHSKHLGLLGGGTYSEADDINTERFIAGYGERIVSPAPAYESAFLYHFDFRFYELPPLSSIYKSCRALALNERISSGLIQVVGHCRDASDRFRAVRWDVRVMLIPVVGPTP